MTASQSLDGPAVTVVQIVVLGCWFSHSPVFSPSPTLLDQNEPNCGPVTNWSQPTTGEPAVPPEPPSPRAAQSVRDLEPGKDTSDNICKAPYS